LMWGDLLGVPELFAQSATPWLAALVVVTAATLPDVVLASVAWYDPPR